MQASIASTVVPKDMRQGHATVRSSKCKAHGTNTAPKIFSRATGDSVVEGATTPAALTNAPELQAYRELATMDDADDMDEYDSLPFDQILDDSDVHDTLFHRFMMQEDADACTGDEDVQVTGGTLQQLDCPVVTTSKL